MPGLGGWHQAGEDRYAGGVRDGTRERKGRCAAEAKGEGGSMGQEGSKQSISTLPLTCLLPLREASP